MDYATVTLFLGYSILLVLSGVVYLRSQRVHLLSLLIFCWSLITISANYLQILLMESGHDSMVIPNYLNQARFVFYNLFILASFLFMKDSLKIFYFMMVQTLYVIIGFYFFDTIHAYQTNIAIFNFCYFLAVAVIYFGLLFRREVLENVYTDPATFVVIGFAVYAMTYLMITFSLWALFPDPQKAHHALIQNYNYGFWAEVMLLLFMIIGLVRYFINGTPSFESLNSKYFHTYKEHSLISNKLFFLKPFQKGLTKKPSV